MTGPEAKPFPDKGPTLAINGIGQRSLVPVQQFLRLLKATGGANELLGVSLVGVHPSEREKLESIVQQPEPYIPFWKKPFQTRPAERVFNPTISLNNPEEATGNLITSSEALDDTLRAVFHFVSYERGNERLIPQTLADYRQYLPDIEQYAVVMIPPGSVVEKSSFDKVAQECPVDSLGLPVILMDHQPPDHNFLVSNPLSAQEVLLSGLAGVISNRRTLPDINPDSYLDLLRTLTDSSKILGVGLHQRDQFHDYTVQRAEPHDLSMLISHMLYDMEKIENLDANRFTSLPPVESSPTNVIALQLPIPPDHKFWNNEYFRGMLNAVRETAQGQNAAVTFGHLDASPKGTHRLVPMTTTRFYPATFVPGWNFIMEAIKNL